MRNPRIISAKMSFTTFLYHIVFATKNREPVISESVERRVYGLIYETIVRMGGEVLRIGGMPEHVHIFTSIPGDVAVSEFIKELKRQTSTVIKREGIVHGWAGWQEGYSAFTFSRSDRENVINYIKGQKEHHKRVTFIDEYRAWLIENGVSEDAPFFP